MVMFSCRIIILLFSCLFAESVLPTQYIVGPNQIRYATHGWPSRNYIDLRHGPDGSLFAGTNSGLGKINALPYNLSESEIEYNLYKIIDPNLPEGGNPAVKTYPLNDGNMLIIVSGITSIDDPDELCMSGSDAFCQVGTGISWSVDSGETWKYMEQPSLQNNNKFECAFNNEVSCFDATWGGISYEHGVWSGYYDEKRVANVAFEVAADTNYEYIYAANWYGLLKRFKYTSENPTWESVPLPRNSDDTFDCSDFPPDNYYYGPAFDDNHRPFSVEISDGYIWVGSLGVNKGEIIGEHCINWSHYTTDNTSNNYNYQMPSDWVTGIYTQKLNTGIRIWTINWTETIGAHHLAYTDNYGQNWRREPYFSNDGSVRAVVYNLYSVDSNLNDGIDSEDNLYASTSKGLFKFESLNNWVKEDIANNDIFNEMEIFNENNPDFEVQALIIDQNKNFLVGTTFGLLVRDPSNQFYYPSYVDDYIAGNLIARVYPNPYLLDSHNHATFSVSSTNSGKLEVYDFSMSKVFNGDCDFDNGQNLDCKWFGLNNRGERVNNGVYFLKVETDGKTYWEKLGVVKFK